MAHRRLMIVAAESCLVTFVAAVAVFGSQREAVSFKNADAPSAVTAADSPSASPDSAIVWARSFTTARQLVKADQVIFVDVYAHWCSWCRYMDTNIYTDPGVKAYAAKNVFVKLDAEDLREGETFARSAGVRAYPTLLVYASDGRLIGRMDGAFRRPADMLKWLDKVARHK